MVFFKNYLSILFVVVCIHINNPCLAWSKVDACITEITDAFADCSSCSSCHCINDYVENIFRKKVYTDIKSTYVRKFINYIFHTVFCRRKYYFMFVDSPSLFCYTIFRDQENECIDNMKYSKLPLRDVQISVRKVFYEWNFTRVQNNVYKDFISTTSFGSEPSPEYIKQYMDHIEENFFYRKKTVSRGFSVDNFCRKSTKTTFEIDPKLEAWLKTDDIKESILNDCIEKIRKSFEGCKSGYSKYIFYHIIYKDIDNIYTKFFVDFLYTAVSPSKNGGSTRHTGRDGNADESVSS